MNPALFFLNLIAKTFTGQNLEEIEIERINGQRLQEINRLMEIRLAQHGYTFRSQLEMSRAIASDRRIQALINRDSVLADLLKANHAIPANGRTIHKITDVSKL